MQSMPPSYHLMQLLRDIQTSTRGRLKSSCWIPTGIWERSPSQPRPDGPSLVISIRAQTESSLKRNILMSTTHARAEMPAYDFMSDWTDLSAVPNADSSWAHNGLVVSAGGELIGFHGGQLVAFDQDGHLLR